MATPAPHISLPRPFASGDVAEWFQRYEICCRANAWDAEKKALKLPTLLEGEALAVWLELTADQQKDYDVTKAKIIDAIMPMRFVSLDDFHKRSLLPGESLTVYVHQLKQLLTQAMPGIADAARDQLLLHQFLSGLPQEVSKQLRAMGATDLLKTAVERAKVLMTVEQHSDATAAVKTQHSSEFQQLQQQLATLTEQVAALSVAQPSISPGTSRKRCFLCNRVGHLQHSCPNQRPRYDSRRCFICNEPGHLWRVCPQGNGQGAAAMGSSRPGRP